MDAHQLFTRSSEPLECFSDNASDYYGLGVRLGIYFAWLNAYLTHTLLPSSIGSAASANTMFLLTLVITMTKDSFRQHLHQVDGLILMHLCAGSTFGVLSIWGYRTRVYKDKGPRAVGMFGSWGTHFRVAISLAISVYGLWFWIYGVVGGLDPLGPGDGMEEGKNAEGCAQVWTFFFAKVKADEGIRYYYIVVCAGCALYFGAMVAASSLSVWFSAARLLGIAGDRWSEAAHVDTMVRPKYVTGFNVKELSIIYKFLRVGNALWLIWSLITVEITLNFNHLNGVLGGPDNDLSKPGQLLPFLIGGFGFCETLYQILKRRVFQKGFHDAPEQSTANSYGNGLGPTVLRSTTDMDKMAQSKRTWQRYLVAWLPWLSLLHQWDRKMAQQGIVREGKEDLGGSLPPTPSWPLTGGTYSSLRSPDLMSPTSYQGGFDPYSPKGVDGFSSAYHPVSHYGGHAEDLPPTQEPPRKISRKELPSYR